MEGCWLAAGYKASVERMTVRWWVTLRCRARPGLHARTAIEAERGAAAGCEMGMTCTVCTVHNAECGGGRGFVRWGS